MKISNSSKIDRLGVQCVGYKFERFGYVFREQMVSDFGIDAQIELLDEDSATGKLIAVQIKSGKSWFKETNDRGYVYRGDMSHLDYWLHHSLPVLIILCDVDEDECYWQAITPNTVIYTNTAWKIEVPKNQKINAGMHVDMKRLVQKMPVYKSYTISSIEENSHNAAKRYSLRVVLNKEHTQAELIDVVKNCTLEAINCKYHRSEITRNRWSDTPAHVVWLFVFPTSEDEKNNNYICRSEWFSDNLDPNFLPMSHGGEYIGLNIKVAWDDNYLANSRFNAEHSICKEKFVLATTEIKNLVEPFVCELSSRLKDYDSGRLEFEGLVSVLYAYFPKINKLYNAGLEIGLSPYECKEISNKFQNLIAHADSICLLAYHGVERNEELDERQVVFNVRSQLGYYVEATEGFEFELKKVQ